MGDNTIRLAFVLQMLAYRRLSSRHSLLFNGQQVRRTIQGVQFRKFSTPPSVEPHKQNVTQPPSSSQKPKGGPMKTESLVTKLKRSVSARLPEAIVSRIQASPHVVKRADIEKKVTFGSVATTIKSALAKIPGGLKGAGKYVLEKTMLIIKNPSVIREWGKHAWMVTKRELKHYWAGTKLLWFETKTATRLYLRKAQGGELTRREQMQLIRTYADIKKLGPFMVFVIVPFMEFTLPFFLMVFPNMLPSTFEDPKMKEQARKTVAQRRTEMASYLQEMVVEMEKNVRKSDNDEKKISALVDFVEHSRNNSQLPQEILPLLIQTFNDDMTIDSMEGDRIRLMCRYLGVPVFFNDNYVRNKLREKINHLKRDDHVLYWESKDGSLNDLTLEELKNAAMERGMIALSDDPDYYRVQLKQWVELSVTQNVPISMLVLSRAFALTGPMFSNLSAEKVVKAALDENEVKQTLTKVVDTTNFENVDKSIANKAKLEVIQSENELIKKEQNKKKEE